jgi:hypothetical protein
VTPGTNELYYNYIGRIIYRGLYIIGCPILNCIMKTGNYWVSDIKCEQVMGWEWDLEKVKKVMPHHVEELEECIEMCRYLLEEGAPTALVNRRKNALYRGNKIIREMICRLSVFHSDRLVALY